MKKVKVLIPLLCVAFIVFGMVSGVSATPVNITLATATVIFGEDTSVPAIEAIIFPLMPGATELYRVTPGDPNVESAALAGSYSAEFLPDNVVKENAIVTYTGGDIIGPIAYLLAKDGRANDTNPATHAWYLYDLTTLGWTGTEQITITGLWPDQGSFSHISMYGTTGTSVPEPMTLILLGLGLAGVAGTRRFKK
jgi:hypothetical protein